MTMNICLIDADSVIPNLALMKISSYYKKRNAKITLLKANLPYYPNKRKKKFTIQDEFDIIYCSVVFTGNKEMIKGHNIIFGGTGYDLITKLPEDILLCEPDYSIYPENDISYGFLSRGCIRNCSFCVVPKKEGYIRQVSTVDEIVKHKKVKFLDNNFLALENHKEILQELVDKKIKCQFNQGLDIRLLDKENSSLLSKMNYLGDYIFAFDDWKYLNIVRKKIELLKWAKPFQIKFFVYIDPKMKLSDTVKRIEWLKSKKMLPYIMRDISCWDSIYNDFYIDISAYTNQVHIFKKMLFSEFLEKRHKNKKRIERSKELYYNNL